MANETYEKRILGPNEGSAERTTDQRQLSRRIHRLLSGTELVEGKTANSKKPGEATLRHDLDLDAMRAQIYDVQ